MPFVNGNFTIGGFVDLQRNALNNAQIQNLGSDPGTAVLGQVFFHTGTGKLRICTNATGPVFADVSTAGGDFSSNTATSVDGEVVVFSGTAGKTGKRLVLAGPAIPKITAGVISAASVGTDYSGPTSALATGILKSTTSTGALSIAVASTDYIGATSGSAVQKASSGGLTAATAGTDFSAGTSALATGVLKSTTTTGALTIAAVGTDYSVGTSALATGLLKSTTTTGALTIATAGTDYLTPSGNGSALTGITESQVTNLVGDLALKAPLASPTFTGTVLLPATGAGASEAATKSYVDGLAQGIFYKASVKAASTANVTLSTGLVNGQTIDGITLVTGDRILLKNQTNHQDDGIYIAVASGTGTRATDMDTAAEAGAGATVFVDTGTVNTNSQWTQTNTIATLGTTVMTWVKTFQSPDLTGQAIPRTYSGLCGDGSLGTGSGTPIVVTHNLALTDRDAFTWDLKLRSSHTTEYCEVTSIDTNSVGLWGWTAAPASNAYYVTIQG